MDERGRNHPKEKRDHRSRGPPQDDGGESTAVQEGGEPNDLISQVHMKLSAQLESRTRQGLVIRTSRRLSSLPKESSRSRKERTSGVLHAVAGGNVNAGRSQQEETSPDQADPALCGAEVPQVRALQGNMARQLSDALPMTEKEKERERREGCRCNWEDERAVTKNAERMRDRRQSVFEFQEANVMWSLLRP